MDIRKLNVPTVSTKAKSDAVARQLNADPHDDWSYAVEAVNAASDRFAIISFDEDGRRLEYL